MIDAAQPRHDPGLEEVYMQRGVILVHIPKNAGTSVERALYDYRIRHRTWREIRDSCPAAWAALPKIAIIREPVDRFLSAYDYLRSGGRNETDRRFAARMIGDTPVQAFLDRLESDIGFRAKVMRYFHFRKQADFVCDGADPVLDHLIPFTEMAAGLAIHAGLPAEALRHDNRTSGKRTDRSALSDDTLRRIRTLYAPDIRLHRFAVASWDATRRGTASGRPRPPDRSNGYAAQD